MSKYLSGRGHDEDYELVWSCKKGDLDAFEVLVGRYQKKLFNIAFRMTGSYEDACEIVQDVFVSAYKNIGGFKGDSRFSTWLYTITINLSRNRLKTMKAASDRQAYSLDAPVFKDDGGRKTDPPSDSPSALELLEKRDLQRKIQECINALEKDFRAVVVLRDIQGFAYEEISDILKLAEGTVKSRLFRARDLLRKCLRETWGFFNEM